MNLRQYAEACTSTTGLVHSVNVKALRDYIKTQPVEGLIKEIKGLIDPASFRAIWEAGVPAQLQATFFERVREVG